MADENPDLYEKYFSYRVHYVREMKNLNGGSAVFGEEARLSATTLEEANEEMKAWVAEKASDPLLSNFRLLEVRWLKKSA